MRLCVREKRRESYLRIGPAACADPRLRPDEGVAAVGGDGERCRDAMPIGDSGVNCIRVKAYIADHTLVENEVFGRRGDVRKALNQNIILYILAEGGEINLARGEANRGHWKPRSSGIDHRDPCQRRGLAAKMRPNAERLIEAQRGFKQRDSAPVGARIDMANADHGKSRLRERDRGGKAGGASAGNENIGLCFGDCKRHEAAFASLF